MIFAPDLAFEVLPKTLQRQHDSARARAMGINLIMSPRKQVRWKALNEVKSPVNNMNSFASIIAIKYWAKDRPGQHEKEQAPSIWKNNWWSTRSKHYQQRTSMQTKVSRTKERRRFLATVETLSFIHHIWGFIEPQRLSIKTDKLAEMTSETSNLIGWRLMRAIILYGCSSTSCMHAMQRIIGYKVSFHRMTKPSPTPR